MSTTDATDVEFTKRQSKSVKIDVICLVAIKEYNHGMQGVAQFNRLLTLFSMADLYFDKYYKKVAMILMDFALTNAYLHYKMDHPNLEKKYTRCTFMEKLQYQMIHVDWAKKARALNRNDLNEDDDEDDTLSVDRHIHSR